MARQRHQIAACAICARIARNSIRAAAAPAHGRRNISATAMGMAASRHRQHHQISASGSYASHGVLRHISVNAYGVAAQQHRGDKRMATRQHISSGGE